MNEEWAFSTQYSIAAALLLTINYNIISICLCESDDEEVKFWLYLNFFSPHSCRVECFMLVAVGAVPGPEWEPCTQQPELPEPPRSLFTFTTDVKGVSYSPPPPPPPQLLKGHSMFLFLLLRFFMQNCGGRRKKGFSLKLEFACFATRWKLALLFLSASACCQTVSRTKPPGGRG